MATRSSFYAEDTVCLKQDPSVIATVEVTWREVDSTAFDRSQDWIIHNGVTVTAANQCIREAQPPTGHVTIRFLPPNNGYTLIKEDDLLLLDRAFTIGDVVKRRPADAQSGMVLKTSETCLIEPIYKHLPFTGSEPWPFKAEDNRLLVSAEDLVDIEWEEGDRVIFRDWIGEIVDVIQDVTIRLGNGSIVKVDEPELLHVPDYTHSKVDNALKKDLPTVLSHYRRLHDRKAPHAKKYLISAMSCWPGMEVTTTKANLRLGTWKVGRYDAGEAPKGVVVDVHVTSIQVEWVGTKLFVGGPPAAEPHEMIEWPELEEVRLYNGRNLSSTSGLSSNELGTRAMNDIGAGDRIRFRDVPGAATKYSVDAPNSSQIGVFRRIPRNITDGFDMNVFNVKQTNTTVWVQWQSGKITQEPAVDLLPYLNVDDYDVWPGEIVSMRSEELAQEQELIELKKVGVVQSVDAQERTAQVRWFSSPSVSVYQHSKEVLYSGARLGPISDEQTTCPLYDIAAYPALSKRRGDLVILAPGVPNDSSQAAVDPKIVPTNSGMAGETAMAEDPSEFDPQNILSTSEVRWFGEVIDLTLDGELIVRLGGLDQVEDIRMPIQRVNVIIGGDDPDGFGSHTNGSASDESMANSDDDADDWGSIDDEEEVISEETVYEGGDRLDDGDEDAWMTDGSEAEEMSFKKTGQPDSFDSSKDEQNTPEDERATTNSHDARSTSNSNIEALGDSHNTNGEDRGLKTPLDLESSATPTTVPLELGLATYQNQPPSFQIMDDDPPESHHYLHFKPSFSSSFLRQIQREHAILSSSLPEGIWVRTWADRLDLLQVLILGPRGTPYALAPFLFDVFFRSDYPRSPPATHFHSWTNGVGRVNPNLYEDGNVCLSILGTWQGNSAAEGWSGEKSSLLQVLVSLLGLVLVEQPYYNEAGFETLVRAEESGVPARIYAERALCLSKGFIAHALTKGCGALTDVVQWLYRDPAGPKFLTSVLQEIQELRARRKDEDTTNAAVERSEEQRPLSAGAEALLRRFVPILEDIAKNLPPAS